MVGTGSREALRVWDCGGHIDKYATATRGGVVPDTLFINWWWIIIGLFVAAVIWGANKRSGSENLIDAAMFDCEFYEGVNELDGWIYPVDESAIQEKE